MLDDEDVSFDMGEIQKLRSVKKLTNLDLAQEMKSYAREIDITKVEPTSLPLKLYQEKDEKNKLKGEEIRRQIQEMKLNEELERKKYYLNRQKLLMQNQDQKPPLAPQTPAGPASNKKKLRGASLN